MAIGKLWDFGRDWDSGRDDLDQIYLDTMGATPTGLSHIDMDLLREEMVGDGSPSNVQTFLETFPDRQVFSPEGIRQTATPRSYATVMSPERYRTGLGPGTAPAADITPDAGPPGPGGPGGPRGPSLEDLLAQQQQILRDMVARGMMGVDEAEAAYTQAVAGIYADFQNEQNITRTGFDADVAARGTQRQQDRQDSMDALIAAGVDPRGSAGDQLASDQAYDSQTRSQEDYMDALMRISEMGEGSRQLAGEREFGGARRSLNETQAQGFAGLESQAAMARALSGVSGTSPADLFAGMLSGMDTVGMQQRKNAAGRSEANELKTWDLAQDLYYAPGSMFGSVGEAYAVLTGQLGENYVTANSGSLSYEDILNQRFASTPGLLSSLKDSIANLVNIDGLSEDFATKIVMDQFDAEQYDSQG